jgi:soluble lytic murein transglycosylase-like protein
VASDKAGTLAASIAAVVTEITGTSDPVQAQQRLSQDPAIAANLRSRLAEIAVSAQQVQNADQESQRKAELETLRASLQDTADARSRMVELVKDSSLIAYAPAIVSIIVTGGLFIFLLVIAINGLTANATGAQIINIAVGSLTAGFATVINFWLGSSQGSRKKDDAALQLQVSQANQNQQLQATQADQTREAIQGLKTLSTKVVANAPVLTNLAVTPAVAAPAPDALPDQPSPAKPAPPGLLAEVMPSLVVPHKLFAEGVSWAVTGAGISIETAPARGTPGEPITVRTIWQRYGEECLASAKKYGVPVELIVATIATESGGDASARRVEKAVNDESVGLMQTLVRTARGALGQPGIKADDLLASALSIEAGTAYIAQQRGSTHFDPPLVAAAYNAGSLRRDPAEANRWQLVCYPIGTGRHIDNFTGWFADAMKVSAEDGWTKQSEAPGFAGFFPTA